MQDDQNLERLGGLFNLDRLKALSDGVLTVVITIMVLSIDIPTDHKFSEQGLWSFLEKIGYNLFLYCVSFWLVAVYWVQHCAMFHYLRYGNRILFWLNLWFLFPVTLLPFVTKLKGIYPHEPAATLLFGILQVLSGLGLLAIWRYVVSHPHLLHRPIEPRVNRSMTLRVWVSPILISLAAIAVSYVAIHVSTAMFLSIPLFYFSHRAIDSRWAASTSD